MNDDPRCCGSGTCIIDATGNCWCGQQWDGEKMCHPAHRFEPEATAAPDENGDGQGDQDQEP